MTGAAHSVVRGARPPAMALALVAFGCAGGGACRGGGGGDARGPLPSPREAAALPPTLFSPSPAGPGLGPELVFARGAVLAGEGLLLDPPDGDEASLAIVRWLGVTPGLVSELAFATPPDGTVELAVAPTSASSWSFSPEAAPAAPTDGVLLLAARNPGSSPVTIDLALAFTTPATLPVWEAADVFGVGALPEPSGIDHDFFRDRVWVVSDTGDLGRVHPDSGAVEAQASFPGTDLEAVRWVPGLDLLLLADESSDELLLVDPDALTLRATASLVFASGLTPVPAAGGDGVEGLAITGVTGRTIHLLLANQNDPHAIYVADLTLPDPIPAALVAMVHAVHPQPAVNLSEVAFDWGSRRAFALHGYVSPPSLARLSADLSSEEATRPLDELSAEGVTFRGASVLLARDLGGVRVLALP